MTAAILDKVTGVTRSAPMDGVRLDGPSVVKLPLNRRDVENVEQQGNDLLLHRKMAPSIRIIDFYDMGYGGNSSDLILRDQDGRVWMAYPELETQFYELPTVGKLLQVSKASMASETGILAYDAFEGQGSPEDILERYLSGNYAASSFAEH